MPEDAQATLPAAHPMKPARSARTSRCIRRCLDAPLTARSAHGSPPLSLSPSLPLSRSPSVPLSPCFSCTDTWTLQQRAPEVARPPLHRLRGPGPTPPFRGALKCARACVPWWGGGLQHHGCTLRWPAACHPAGWHHPVPHLWLFVSGSARLAALVAGEWARKPAELGA